MTSVPSARSTRDSVLRSARAVGGPAEAPGSARPTRRRPLDAEGQERARLAEAATQSTLIPAARSGTVPDVAAASSDQARCRTKDLGQGRRARQHGHVPGEAAEVLERHRKSAESEDRSAVRPRAALRARRPACQPKSGCSVGAALRLNSSAGSAA